MDLSIIEIIRKSPKTGQTIFRVKTKCFCCGEEMVVAMCEEIYADYKKYLSETWCQDCAVTKGKVSEREVRETNGRFYLSLLYVPEKSHKGDKPIDYHKYLQTEHWQKVRQAAIERAGARCQLCNKPGILHVHHRTYENVGNEQPEDLIALCAHCHAKFHDKLD
jgi:hypothetical protein